MRGVRVVLALVMLACSGEVRPVELRVGLDPAAADFGQVEVWGLPPLLRARLATVPPGDGRWEAALTVEASADGAPVPPLAGQYRIEPQGCLRFTPRYPPEGKLGYRVRLDRRALAALAGTGSDADSALQWSFRLPGRPAPPPTATITALHPSAPVVPANQLRWYVEFSAPMREGEALDRVQLLDERGQVVEGAFLRREEELWNPDRTRITLLFDMARVKHDIRRRREVGPVLEAGRRYTLRISREWRDARGAPLLQGLEHEFRATTEDHSPVEPARWLVHAPAIGSRMPLTVRFGEPLDHALAQHLLTVTRRDGTPVTGTVRLAGDDRSWQFVPDAPWYAERYQVRVHPALEDLSGNRVGHVFDADLRAGEGAGVDTTAVVREFFPAGEPGGRRPGA